MKIILIIDNESLSCHVFLMPFIPYRNNACMKAKLNRQESVHLVQLFDKYLIPVPLTGDIHHPACVSFILHY